MFLAIIEKKEGTLEKGGWRKAKKNLGLDFMLKRVEPDENGVKKGGDGSASALLAEPEKVLGRASEMDGKALILLGGGGGGGGEEVGEERRTHVEEVVKEREGGNDTLDELVAHSPSPSRLTVEDTKVQQGVKKNLSLGFMLRKSSRGDAVENINEQGLDSIPEDILAERDSSSSLKLPTDRKVRS